MEKILKTIEKISAKSLIKDLFVKNNVILLLGDSKEILPEFEEEFFNAIITDPPYGVGSFDYDAETEAEVFFELEDEFYRVLKKDAWFVFWYSIKGIPKIVRLKKFCYRWLIIAYFLNTFAKSFLGDRKFTPIFVFSKGKPSVETRIGDVLPYMEIPGAGCFKVGEGDFKATLIQSLLLDAFVKEKGIVLDPFSGYGSLLLSALRTRKDTITIGIEKNEERFEATKKILLEEKLTRPIHKANKSKQTKKLK